MKPANEPRAPTYRSLDECFDEEERLAWQGLDRSVRSFGEHLGEASGLPSLVRAHPRLVLGLSLCAGIVAAPVVGRSLRALGPLLGNAAANLRGGRALPFTLLQRARPRA